MKKTIAILMVLVLALSVFVGCSKKEEAKPAATEATPVATETKAAPEAPKGPTAADLNGITLQMWHAQSKANGDAVRVRCVEELNDLVHCFTVSL